MFYFAVFLSLFALSSALTGIQRIQQKVTSNCSPTKDAFALTFSDGIFHATTYSILDILDSLKVKATFFVSGFQLADSKNEAAIKEAVARGHTIGTMGFSHRDMTKLSDEEFEMEIKLSCDAIENATGNTTKVKFFRPPYGTYSESMVDKLKSFDLKVVNHNVNPMDWRNGATQREIVNCVEKCVSKHNSGILLLHDLYPSTVQALPAIVRKIKQLGKKIVPLEQCVSGGGE